MGCVASNNAAHVTPTFEASGVLEDLDSSGEFDFASSLWNRPRLENGEFGERSESAESEKMSSGNSSVSFRMWNMNRQAEAEQIAAGWPAWLSNVAGEAIHGWVPLKADSFQKLEKVISCTSDIQFNCVVPFFSKRSIKFIEEFSRKN